MSDFDSRARKAADAVRRQVAENTFPPRRESGARSISPARAAIPGAIAAAVVLIVAVAVALPRGGGDGTPSGGYSTAYAMAGALRPFNTCDTVLEYFKDQAPEYLIQRAGGGDMTTTTDQAGPPVRTRTAPQQGRAADSSGAAESADTPEHSKTNVQEAGIDEPDIVKTDGNRIVAVAQARAHLVGLDGGKMTLRKTLPDTMVRNVFLSGDRVLVFSGQTAQSFEPWIAPGRSAGRSDDA